MKRPCLGLEIPSEQKVSRRTALPTSHSRLWAIGLVKSWPLASAHVSSVFGVPKKLFATPRNRDASRNPPQAYITMESNCRIRGKTKTSGKVRPNSTKVGHPWLSLNEGNLLVPKTNRKAATPKSPTHPTPIRLSCRSTAFRSRAYAAASCPISRGGRASLCDRMASRAHFPVLSNLSRLSSLTFSGLNGNPHKTLKAKRLRGWLGAWKK